MCYQLLKTVNLVPGKKKLRTLDQSRSEVRLGTLGGLYNCPSVTDQKILGRERKREAERERERKRERETKSKTVLII